jgi:hypothetical protein
LHKKARSTAPGADKSTLTPRGLGEEFGIEKKLTA